MMAMYEKREQRNGFREKIGGTQKAARLDAAAALRIGRRSRFDALKLWKQPLAADFGSDS